MQLLLRRSGEELFVDFIDAGVELKFGALSRWDGVLSLSYNVPVSLMTSHSKRPAHKSKRIAVLKDLYSDRAATEKKRTIQMS